MIPCRLQEPTSIILYSYRKNSGVRVLLMRWAYDFDMKFTFACVGWEGSTYDTRIFLSCLNNESYNFPKPPVGLCGRPFFWLNRVGMPPAILGPNILSKGVETGPITTQFGPACTQTMPCLPRTCLRQAELFQMSCGGQI